MARQCWRGARTDTAKEKPRRYARGRYWTRESGLGGFHILSRPNGTTRSAPRSCALPIKTHFLRSHAADSITIGGER